MKGKGEKRISEKEYKGEERSRVHTMNHNQILTPY